MKKFSSVTQKTGELGELIATRYFSERGFRLVERNYTKKWGEIDIIVEKGGITHFVEVKSVSRKTLRIFHMKPPPYGQKIKCIQVNRED
jgi:Holliday junction resolvase-like predicted endonuclease